MAPRENNVLIHELVTLESVKMYFGTYVFFNNDAFPVIDHIAWFVDSETKLKMVCPISRYTG